MSDKFVTLDSETVGFQGPIVLLQWSEGFGPVHLHSVWMEKVKTTIDLIEYIVKNPVLGFNLAFDWFHICQMYTTLKLLDPGWTLIDHIDDYAIKEKEARDGPCLKPVSACDIMLWARKGPYQNLMNRDPIRIRKVPRKLAVLVADELEKRVKLRDIFFARKKKKSSRRWVIRDIPGDPDFVHIELVFSPASGLKALATDALNLDPNETLVYKDIEVDPKWNAVESAFAPFALAHGKPGNWNGSWPDVIEHHIQHWTYNQQARVYAERDIIYPRELYKKFGSPEFGDDDSELSILAGAARWKGYAINRKGIQALKRKAEIKKKQAPIRSKQILSWVSEVMDEIEILAMTDEFGKPSAKRTVLEEIAKQNTGELCCKCKGIKPKKVWWGKLDNKCEHCRGVGKEPTEASKRANMSLDSKRAEKEEKMYEFLLIAERLHASVNIIGTRSGRKSGGAVSEGKRGKKGGGSINPQGIQKQKRIRAQFQLAFTNGMCRIYGLPGSEDEEILSGGDFDAFEVGIADSYYNDPQLHTDLTAPEIGRDGKPNGKEIKIHAVIGSMVYPGMSYWDIRDTADTDNDKYTRSKSAFFALLYFGNAFTLASRLAIDTKDGEAAYQNIMKRYPKMAKERKKFEDWFAPMKQPGGIGTKAVWTTPRDYCESMLGFKRYFTLENQICHALFTLGEQVPKEWRQVKGKIVRREREQTISGATQSAIIGACFQLQNANVRAAGNHVIQSTGAQLTKMLERRIWNLQPTGIHKWHVRPMNSHDELMVPMIRSVAPRVHQITLDFLKEFRALVPMLNIKWKTGITSWAGK